MDLSELKNKSILIIDDDEEFNILMSHTLKRIGFSRIDTEVDPLVGFNKLLFYQPDLLILDIIMPGSNGMNLGKAIDTIHDNGIPTLFVSADKSNEKKIKASNFQNVAKFLPKPISKNVLTDAISDIFNQVSHNKKFFPRINRSIPYSRPISIIIIALLHIFEPITKILYFKAYTEFPLSVVLSNILSIDNTKSFFEFWLLFPLAGFALLSIRKWAYIFFLTVQCYAIYTHFTYQEFTWPYISKTPLLSSTLLLAINILIIIYFLIPAVRRPFFHRRLRLWETAPRFKINIPCKIETKLGTTLDCNLINLSKTGAFISSPTPFEMFENIIFNFTFYNFKFSLRGKVVNRHISDNINGYGIKFSFIQFGNRINMLRLIKALKVLNS